VLSVRGLRAGYGAIEVLHGIDLDVEAGEIVAVLGSNGAGKTTTLRAIVGELRPKAGRVTFDGANIAGHTSDRCARLGVSLVPEGRGIFADLTVRENLEMGCWTLEDRSQVPRRVDEVTEIFPVLKDRMGQRAGTLSGGEQQMLSIARALAAKPKLLLIDEMSQGLAPMIVRQLFDILREIRAAGSTILLVEQQVGEALALSDRAYLLENGEIATTGRSSELAESAAALEASYLGAELPAEYGTDEALEAGRTRAVQSKAGSAGREAGMAAPEAGPTTPEKILVSLTPAEKRRLQAMAETAGCSVGDLLAQAFRDWRQRSLPRG